MGTPLTCCLGGEGCFNTELTGEGSGGYVYLQSLSYEKLIKILLQGQSKPGKDGGEGGGGGVPDTVEMSR